MQIKIQKQEFKERVKRTQELMKKENIDLLLTFGNEIEAQFVRYYSNYWPSFETTGVLIPVEGEPTLIIGPESKTFALQSSQIDRIRPLLVFRESSDPEYPDMKLPSFYEVIHEAIGEKSLDKVGIAGYSLISKVVYDDFANALEKFGNNEIIKADHIVSKLRAIKSPQEIQCMQEAYRITEKAMQKVLEEISVGMTEEMVKGIAIAEMYKHGAEGEAYPAWILTGENSNLAIGRCRGKTIEDGDLVQIQIGARYQGYASTIGRAVVMGTANEIQRSIIEASIEGEKAIINSAKAGSNAIEVVKAHRDAIKKLGHEDHILYGPSHGTGLMEGEYPWIESTSDFTLQEGMTFCACTYLGDDENKIGVRFEDGYVVTKEGGKAFSDYKREFIEIK